MKIGKSQPSAASMSYAPHTVVSAVDYAKLAIAHVQANGGVGVALTERGQPSQWRAWIAYADALSPRMGRTWRALKTITVPTAWPIEFDLSAPETPFELERDEQPVSLRRRKELADRLRALVADWEAPKSPGWQAPDARHVLDARTAPTPELRAQAVAYHEKRLAELARIYAASDDDARRQAESS
jgi:hypothetical protein